MNKRVEDLILDYKIRYERTRIMNCCKQIELLEYHKYLIELGKIYNDAKMFDEVFSLLKYMDYIDNCFI